MYYIIGLSFPIYVYTLAIKAILLLVNRLFET